MRSWIVLHQQDAHPLLAGWLVCSSPDPAHVSLPAACSGRISHGVATSCLKCVDQLHRSSFDRGTNVLRVTSGGRRVTFGRIKVSRALYPRALFLSGAGASSCPVTEVQRRALAHGGAAVADGTRRESRSCCQVFASRPPILGFSARPLQVLARSESPGEWRCTSLRTPGIRRPKPAGLSLADAPMLR